jgi:hypothetical protein
MELTLSCWLWRWYGFLAGPFLIPLTLASMTPTLAGIAFTLSRKRGPSTFFSDHLGCFVFRFRRQKNKRAHISARPATPPTTPPTMLPIFASPLVGRVRPPSESEPPCSGPMIPAAALPVGNDDAGAVVGCGCPVTVVSIATG